MKTLNYFFQSIIIYILFIFGRVTGLTLGRKIFSNIFKKIGPKFRSTKLINKNLDNFSKSLTLDEREKIISSMWKNYGMTFIEYVYLNFFRKQNSHIIIEGEENLKNITEKNKPVIFVSGHFANYELMSMELTKKNIKLATIYRPLNNPFLNPFMEYLRRKYVCKNQIQKGIKGVRETINYLKKDHSIALMIDQRVSEGEKIEFFGKPAFTTTLPAQLAIKFKTSVVPVSIQRIEQKNFKIKIYDEIKHSNFQNKIEMSKKLNEKLENMIKENPDQWIWTHNRWK